VEQGPQDKLPQSFNELIGMTMLLHGRIDTLWQRVIYSHAAMVGVMVFFASAHDPFVVARFLVMLFYTLNSIVTFVAFRDTFNGLKAALEDLKASGQTHGHVFAWISGQNFRSHAIRRAGILLILWVIIAYLLLGDLIGLY
jgi:hypothetical protein